MVPSLDAHLTGDLVDGLGKTLDVAAGDTGHGDTAVLGGVDGVLDELVSARDIRNKPAYLLGQSVHLLGLETSVGEHANLSPVSDYSCQSLFWILPGW